MYTVEEMKCYKVGDRMFSDYDEAVKWAEEYNQVEELLNNNIEVLSVDKNDIKLLIKGKLCGIQGGGLYQLKEDEYGDYGIIGTIIYGGLRDDNIIISPDKSCDDYKADIIKILLANEFYCKMCKSVILHN